MSLFKAGSGNSMARTLMAVLVVATSAAVLIVAAKGKEFNAAMAAAVTGIAGTLAGVWGLSKSKWRGEGPQ